MISGLQNGMKDMLDLEFQLNGVDYTRDNFVHADMSPDDFEKAMADRGESIWSMMFRVMGQAMAEQASSKNTPNDFEILMALFDENLALKLKRILAGQFENLEFVTTALAGPNGSALIEGRNQAALKVLKKQIDAGKKKIAIFYGAGHMPDMEKHLSADFGLKHDGERRLEAWNCAMRRTPRRARSRRSAGNEQKHRASDPWRISLATGRSFFTVGRRFSILAARMGTDLVPAHLALARLAALFSASSFVLDHHWDLVHSSFCREVHGCPACR